ncbi:winged helix-turn-helix domain-containing protein [Bdellovibrio sp. HCB288]|uniref:winged helix-turn-helix domain-containing protein n=1 Tax=Bdellovibrio sp. HCB288 TaxID=3394355 RepID=UPI0039B39C68
MFSEISANLNLAKLNYQRGHYTQVCENSELICSEADAIGDLQSWLVGIRYLIQASSEMGTLDQYNSYFRKLFAYEKDPANTETHGRILHVIGLWQMSVGNYPSAKEYFLTALEECTQNKDLETVSRLLQELAMVSMNQDALEALKYLDKSLLLTKELKLDEIHTGCLILKSHIFLSQKRADDALEAIWKAYEKAQMHSLHYLNVYILVHMASVYEALGKHGEAVVYKSLAMKGIDGDTPHRLQKVKSQFIKDHNKADSADLTIDTMAFKVKSRAQGDVDFKNQHILFDLLNLFAKNPGDRFSKSYLIENVWGYAYNPEVHDNLIYVSIKRLRTLLEPDPNTSVFILRDRKGYFLPSNVTIKFTGL